MKTRLLIDGDIVAFVSAAAAQAIVEDENFRYPWARKVDGEVLVENMLANLMAGLKADTREIYLSDPKDNWRRLVDPLYKTNRTELRDTTWSGGPTDRPLLLDYLKQYLRDRHGATHWEGLEADDTLSILGTTPRNLPDRTIIVGRDKDFKSIPGLHHSWKQDIGPKGEMLVREVTQWEADRFHLIQSLSGDRVDGFSGCPGIGMDRASTILANPVRLVPQEGVKTRGVNKGEVVTRWMAEPTRDYWACIVSHYRKAELTEADALVTARLARLLRYGEYNRDTAEVTLWTPEMIQPR